MAAEQKPTDSAPAPAPAVSPLTASEAAVASALESAPPVPAATPASLGPPTSPSVVTLPRRVVLKDSITDRAELCSQMRSHDVVIARNCSKMHMIIEQNQRMAGVILDACTTCRVSVLDSAVLTSRTIRLVGCREVEIVLEDCDIRRVELFGCSGCRVVLIGDDALLENIAVISREGCTNTKIIVAKLERAATHRAIRSKPLRETIVPDTEGSKRQYASRALRPPMVTTTMIVNDDGVVTEEGAELMRLLARFTAFTTLPAADATMLMSADPATPLPTGAALRAAIAELERVPYTLTDADVEKQYDEERREFEEPYDTLQAKARQVAELLRASHHAVMFTGAGISTAADIPDFRGPRGAWTMRDKGKMAAFGTDMGDARPTFAHYAITELARRGLVKFVVTTNMDALHARTGLPPHLLEELHGSCNVHHCSRCGMRYRRAEEVDRGAPDHRTETNCDWCGGELLDTIVNFSDTYRNELEPVIVQHHSVQCDLAIVLGTSMTVQPAACYPEKCLTRSSIEAGSDGHLVICNLQSTPSDHLATIRAFSTTDKFMRALMEALEITQFDMTFDAKPEWAEDDRLRADRIARRKAIAAAAASPKKDGSVLTRIFPFLR